MRTNGLLSWMMRRRASSLEMLGSFPNNVEEMVGIVPDGPIHGLGMHLTARPSSWLDNVPLIEENLRTSANVGCA